MKKPKKTTTKDFLKMDLQMQSGSIWTDEKSKLQKKKDKLIMKAEKLQKRKTELLQDLEKHQKSYSETLSQYTKIDNKFSKNLEEMNKVYQVQKDNPTVLTSDPVYYNGKKVKQFPSLIID